MYLKTDLLPLTNFFENFNKMCLEIYELGPAKFISAPRLAWQVTLKKAEVKLDLLTDIDILLIVEKGIREGICNAAQHYSKQFNVVFINNYGEKSGVGYILDADFNTQKNYMSSIVIYHFYT